MAVEVNIMMAGTFRNCPDESWLRGVAARVLHEEKIVTNAEMGLVITGQKRIRELNRVYRNIDEPTDVLSFFMSPEDGEPTDTFIAPPDGIRHLGEVIISLPQARKQAKKQRHPLEKELVALITHGVLHLLGYDHEKAGEARKMKHRETEILSLLSEAGIFISP